MLAIDPLATTVRNEANIKGQERGSLEHKVSLYADDMLLYVSDHLNRMPKLLDLLDVKSELLPFSADPHNSLQGIRVSHICALLCS